MFEVIHVHSKYLQEWWYLYTAYEISQIYINHFDQHYIHNEYSAKNPCTQGVWDTRYPCAYSVPERKDIYVHNGWDRISMYTMSETRYPCTHCVRATRYSCTQCMWEIFMYIIMWVYFFLSFVCKTFTANLMDHEK